MNYVLVLFFPMKCNPWPCMKAIKAACKAMTRKQSSPKKGRDVVIFQDSPVIVEHCQTSARIDVKVVGGASVVEVVDNGGHQ